MIGVLTLKSLSGVHSSVNHRIVKRETPLVRLSNLEEGGEMRMNGS